MNSAPVEIVLFIHRVCRKCFNCFLYLVFFFVFSFIYNSYTTLMASGSLNILMIQSLHCENCPFYSYSLFFSQLLIWIMICPFTHDYYVCSGNFVEKFCQTFFFIKVQDLSEVENPYAHVQDGNFWWILKC